MLIHSGADMEFFHHPGRSDFLLVTFNEIGLLADGRNYWGKPMIEANGISAIGIVSRTPNWFLPPDDIDRFLEQHGHILNGFKGRIVLAGHSMGGYGAIKYSGKFGASTVIATCPQYSLNRKARGQTGDGPPDPFYVEALHEDMHPKLHELAGRIFILYDPWHPWKNSFRKFTEMGYRGMNLVKAPFTDHDTIKIFARNERFLELIRLCRTGEAGAVENFVRLCRKNSNLRSSALAIRIALRHPQKAWAIYSAAPEKFSPIYLVLLSRALMNAMPAEAAMLAERAVKIAPDFKLGERHLAALKTQEAFSEQLLAPSARVVS